LPCKDIWWNFWAVFFADDLKPYVDVLAEISDDHIMPRPQHHDVLAVHARYEATGSERDRKWLLEHHVTLLPKSAQEDQKILM